MQQQGQAAWMLASKQTGYGWFAVLEPKMNAQPSLHWTGYVYLSLKVLALSISLRCLHHCNLLSLSLLNSCDPAASTYSIIRDANKADTKPVCMLVFLTFIQSWPRVQTWPGCSRTVWNDISDAVASMWQLSDAAVQQCRLGRIADCDGWVRLKCSKYQSLRRCEDKQTRNFDAWHVCPVRACDNDNWCTEFSLGNKRIGCQESCPHNELPLLRSTIAVKCSDWFPTLFTATTFLHGKCLYQEFTVKW